MASGTRTITYGTIGFDNIATEWKCPTPFRNVALGDFYKENLLVGINQRPLDTSVNINVPFGPAIAGNPISLKDFYGAAWYKGEFRWGGRGETPSQYHTSNDAYLFFQVRNCSSPSMRVIVAGSTINIAGNGYDFSSDTIIIPIGNNDGSSTYTFQYTDCRGTWNRAVTISYGGPTKDDVVDLLQVPPDNKLIRI